MGNGLLCGGDSGLPCGRDNGLPCMWQLYAIQLGCVQYHTDLLQVCSDFKHITEYYRYKEKPYNNRENYGSRRR